MSTVRREERTPEQLSELLAILQAQGFGQASLGALMGEYLSLPGLVGFWPGGARGAGGQMRDLIGGLHLAKNGASGGYNQSDGIPFMSYDGATAYHSIASTAVLNINGAETDVNAAMRGLTMGAWIYVRDAAPATHEYIIGKGADTYQIRHATPSNVLLFRVNNTTTTAATIGSTVPSVNRWYFVVGKFTPSTELAIFVNGDKEASTSSIYSQLNTDSTGFSIGGSDVGSFYFDGRVAFAFLCGAAVPDDKILSLYHMGKRLFGA